MARMASRNGFARDPRLQLHHLMREVFGRMTVGVEQLRCSAIAAGCTAHAKVDATWRQSVEHTKLFRDFEWRIVRQHDASTAQSNSAGTRRNGSHQHLRRGADDAGVAVVFAHPIAVIAPGLTLLSERQRLTKGCVLASARRSDGLIEYREFEHAQSLPVETKHRCRAGLSFLSLSFLQSTPHDFAAAALGQHIDKLHLRRGFVNRHVVTTPSDDVGLTHLPLVGLA